MAATKFISPRHKLFNLSPWRINMSHATSFISLDFETTGLDPYRGDLPFAWSTCNEEGEIVISRYDNDRQSRQRLQTILSDNTIGKVSHNMHFDKNMAISDGYYIPEKTIWHCTKLMCNVLYNLEPSYELDELAYTYGRYPKDADIPIKQAAKIYGNYSKIPRYLMDKYQLSDAERCMLLFLTFWPKICADPILLELYLIEIALVPVTMRFERRGIMVDKRESERLLTWIESELKQVELDKENYFPHPVNVHSPKQLVRFLYTEVGLPILSMNKSGLAPSTDKDAIAELRHHIETTSHDITQLAILDIILKERAYNKGKQMIQSYLDACDSKFILCPHINTHQARTGRESGTNPNLQNVQKSAALKTRYPVPARNCFRTRPGYVLLLKDYAGIEIRIAIQLTGSKRLIKMLHKGFDFHSACAEAFYGEYFTDPVKGIKFYIVRDPANRKKEYQKLIDKIGHEAAQKQLFKKVKSILRSAAKNARFAMLYGAGKNQTAKTLMLSLDEVSIGYDRDRELFPEFYQLMHQCERDIKLRGYVETIFKRKLYVNPRASYASTDYKVQGSAGELFKRSQIRVDKYLQDFWSEYDISIWLVVHDEMIIEIPRVLLSHLPIINSDIDYLMTTYDEITVPLEVGNKLSTYLWSKSYNIDKLGRKL
jgi:DNA polymerase I